MGPPSSARKDRGESVDPSEAEARKVGKPDEDPSKPKNEQDSAAESAKKDPADGKPREKTSNTTTESVKGAPAEGGFPSWMVGLPPQVREQIVNGDPEKVPPAYREMIARYHRWLAERSTTPSSR